MGLVRTASYTNNGKANVTITAGKIGHSTAKEVPTLIQYINAVRRQTERAIRAVVSSLVILRRLSRLILDTVVISLFCIPRHCRCTGRETCRKKQQASLVRTVG